MKMELNAYIIEERTLLTNHLIIGSGDRVGYEYRK